MITNLLRTIRKVSSFLVQAANPIMKAPNAAPAAKAVGIASQPLFKEFPATLSFCPALLREVYIDPTSEEILSVPLGFTMTKQD